MFEKNVIINLNKPTGMSSSLAVQIVKRTLKPNKIGHLGTLDPLGTGVLLIAVNKATKKFDEYLTKIKTYRACFKFGVETDTFDSEGKVLNLDNKVVTLEQINSVLSDFIGEQEQMPPAYSAKKINGKKAYELARQGVEVKLKTKKITIFDIKVVSQLEPNTFMFEIKCSAGTYIRSICRDIAYKLSTYGTMVSIIRTICGDFCLEDSCTLEDVKAGKISYLEI